MSSVKSSKSLVEFRGEEANSTVNRSMRSTAWMAGLWAGMLATVVACYPSRSMKRPLDPDRPSVPLKCHFEWSMEQRVGKDLNGDGRIDVPNTADYANPQSFELNFTACATGGDSIQSYDWLIQGTNDLRSCRTTTPTYKLRGVRHESYNVRLTVTDRNGYQNEHEQAVNPRDIFLAVVGDSYASGEGNPETLANSREHMLPAWADSPDSAARHFSTFCAPALAAISLERSDPKSSVTFVSFASTGATVGSGLLGRQQGKEKVNTPDANLPPQLELLRNVSAGRRIDVLLVSIGGNDAGFVEALRDLVEHDSHPFADDVADIACRVRERFTKLARDLGLLASAISTLNVKPSHVLLMTYPDPFFGRAASILPGDILEDAADSDLEWAGISWNVASASLSPDEMRAARDIFIHPLNALLREAAIKYGWTTVELEDALRGHGYSDELDENGERWSWVNTFQDSMQKEVCPDGTMHPNMEGQRAIAAILYEAYRRVVNEGF